MDQGSVTGWELDWADPGGGPVICHNDGFPENVVFRDGVAVALIDFDMAAPGRPLWDVAIAGQEWLPQHPATRSGSSSGRPGGGAGGSGRRPWLAGLRDALVAAVS